MAETNASGATPGAAIVTAPAAPAPETGSLPPPTTEADFQAKARGATSPGAIRALISESLKKAPPKQPTPEAAKPASEVTPAPEVPPEVPAGEVTPAAEATPETPPETPADQDDDEQPIVDGPVEPSTAKKLRLRLPENDKAGRLAAEFMRRNRDWSMTQALEAANRQLGIKPAAEAPPTPGAPETQPKSDLPETVEAADAKIKELRAERKKANTELRFEEASDLSDKLEDMILHRSHIERQSERRETQATQSYHAKFAESEVQATELYPDAAKPDSAFGQRMKEIDDVLEATGDPRFHAANKPLLCAQMVAAEMNIAPRRKGAPAAPAKAAAPAAPVAPAPKKGILPGGASRTTPPVTNQPPAIDAQIKAATTIGDLKRLHKSLGLRM